MTQIKNKIDIQDLIEDDAAVITRRMPNFFNTSDEMNPLAGIILSVLIHGVVWLLFILLSLMGFVFPRMALPNLPDRDIEFRLVQTETKPPIDKKKAFKSNANSQAGGKHDPKKIVSDPTPKGPKPKKPAPSAKAQPKQVQKPQQKPAQQPKQTVKQPPKQVQKQVQQPRKQPPKQQVTQKPAPVKPSAVKAPSTSLKPAIKPSAQGVSKPSAPKIATTPKSPFAVPVPAGAPKGTTYKPAGSPTSGSPGGSGGAKGSGVPAPKFSSAGSGTGSYAGTGTTSRPSSGSYGSRGSYGGGGTGGNPSPGNPKGAPGINAVKQPNWGPYMRDLEQRIKRNWTPPKGDSSKRVVITFTISRDGRLLNKRLVKSSGVPLADRAAMSAIEQTAPFRPLPPEFKGQSVPIEFTFDYNVLNSVMR